MLLVQIAVTTERPIWKESKWPNKQTSIPARILESATSTLQDDAVLSCPSLHSPCGGQSSPDDHWWWSAQIKYKSGKYQNYAIIFALQLAIAQGALSERRQWLEAHGARDEMRKNTVSVRRLSTCNMQVSASSCWENVKSKPTSDIGIFFSFSLATNATYLRRVNTATLYACIITMQAETMMLALWALHSSLDWYEQRRSILHLIARAVTILACRGIEV